MMLSGEDAKGEVRSCSGLDFGELPLAHLCWMGGLRFRRCFILLRSLIPLQGGRVGWMDASCSLHPFSSYSSVHRVRLLVHALLHSLQPGTFGDLNGSVGSKEMPQGRL